MHGSAGNTPPRLAYRFDHFRLIPSQAVLLASDEPVKLGGRAFELLHFLVQRAGRIVTKAELLDAAWPDIHVGDSNLKVNMSNLRRALGDTGAQAQYVRTIPGRGYMFVTPVEVMVGSPGSLPDANEQAPVQFAADRGELVERDDTIAIVLQALASDRVVTLVGPGGVGKTAVATAAARQFANSCADGLCSVDLSTIDEPTLLPAMLVSALGIKGNPGSGVDAIIDYVVHRHVLLVLESCEHVLPAVTMLVRRLMQRKGHVKILATSREPLGAIGEHLVRIDPLSVPGADITPGPVAARRFGATALFELRAKELANRDLQDADWPAIWAICSVLDGMPLAIELVAAQLSRFSPQQLLSMLDQYPQFSGSGLEPIAARQRTMMATIDWSYCLLQPREAALLRAISVFASEFDLEDVLPIAVVAGIDAADALTGLGALVAKSLVAASVNHAVVRYRLLDSIRRFASDRRREGALDNALLAAHCFRVIAVFERSEDEWNWLDNAEWVRRYSSRLADLRAALGWAYGPGGDARCGVILTSAALMLWSETSILSEAQGRAEQALAHGKALGCDPLLLAKLACSRSWSLFYARKTSDENELAWREAIELSERSGNLEYHQRALIGMAFYLMQIGKTAQAIPYLERSDALAAASRDLNSAPEGDRALAWARAHLGEFTESVEVLERLAARYDMAHLDRRKTRQDVYRFVSVRCYLPFVAWMTGKPDQAAQAANDAVEIAGREGHWVSQANALGLAALPLAIETGNIASLRYYLDALRTNLEREPIARWEPLYRYFEGQLSFIDGDVMACDEVEAAVEEMVECRYLMRVPMYMAGLGRVLIQSGKIAQAERWIGRALAYQHQLGERWCRPELLRMAAMVESAKRRADLAEPRLREAIADARAMGALSFELRSCIDLANLLDAQGKMAEGKAMLEPTYAKFTEGFETRDLLTAARMLQR